MEQFEKGLVSYKGVADFNMKTSTGKKDISGYFEATQSLSGKLTVSMVSTNHPHGIGKMSTTDGDVEHSFQGDSLDGWRVSYSGGDSFTLWDWMLSPFSQHPSERSLNPLYLTAKRGAAPESGYRRAQFLVCNVVWHDPFNEKPEPVELQTADYSGAR